MTDVALILGHQVVLFRGVDQALLNVHDLTRCLGQTCVIHNPSSHHMREWPLHWRVDRGIFERLCPHGVGHPDPDQREHWADTDQDWQLLHGCCVERCCG